MSIADVLVLTGTNPWEAGREIVWSMLDCVDSSDRLRLGRAVAGFDEFAKPSPVEEILYRIFSIEDATDRSFEMTTLFIDEI